MIKMVLWMLAAVLLFEALLVVTDDGRKARFNKCRDDGGSIGFCWTGLKL